MLIPIIIPIGYSYSCTVSGSTFKIVQCEFCRGIYVYRMTRTATGGATDTLGMNPHAPVYAEAHATYALDRILRDDCDAVPCLECGKYQAQMVEALRRDFQLDRFYGAIALLIAAALAGAFSLIDSPLLNDISLLFRILAAIFALSGIALLVLRRYQRNRFDPNQSDLQRRMQLAHRYARSLDDFRLYLEHQGITLNLPASDRAADAGAAQPGPDPGHFTTQ